MGIIIQNKKQYLTRFPFWLAIIILFAFSPAILGIFGGWVTETLTGEPCHEGNCAWMALPWLTLLTLPVGALAFVAYLVIVVIDSVKLARKDERAGGG